MGLGQTDLSRRAEPPRTERATAGLAARDPIRVFSALRGIRTDCRPAAAEPTSAGTSVRPPFGSSPRDFDGSGWIAPVPKVVRNIVPEESLLSKQQPRSESPSIAVEVAERRPHLGNPRQGNQICIELEGREHQLVVLRREADHPLAPDVLKHGCLRFAPAPSQRRHRVYRPDPVTPADGPRPNLGPRLEGRQTIDDTHCFHRDGDDPLEEVDDVAGVFRVGVRVIRDARWLVGADPGSDR